MSEDGAHSVHVTGEGHELCCYEAEGGKHGDAAVLQFLENSDMVEGGGELIWNPRCDGQIVI